MQRVKNFKLMCEYIKKRLHSKRRRYKKIIIYGDIDHETFETLISLIDSESIVYEFSGRKNDQLDRSLGDINLVLSAIISLDRLKQEILDNPPELIVFGEFNWQLRDFLSRALKQNKCDVLIVENCVAKLWSLILSLIFMDCNSTKNPNETVKDDAMPVFLCWDTYLSD
jgi:hypothetical protein